MQSITALHPLAFGRQKKNRDDWNVLRTPRKLVPVPPTALSVQLCVALRNSTTVRCVLVAVLISLDLIGVLVVGWLVLFLFLFAFLFVCMCGWLVSWLIDDTFRRQPSITHYLDWRWQSAVFRHWWRREEWHGQHEPTPLFFCMHVCVIYSLLQLFIRVDACLSRACLLPPFVFFVFSLFLFYFIIVFYLSIVELFVCVVDACRSPASFTWMCLLLFIHCCIAGIYLRACLPVVCLFLFRFF